MSESGSKRFSEKTNTVCYTARLAIPDTSRKEAIDVVVRGVRATAERYLVRSRRNSNARIAVELLREGLR